MESNSKERILNAAIKIIAQKGKHGTRMEEVAHMADINKAMVYYYFSTKDNLYFEVLKTIFFNIFQDSLNNLNENISKGTSHEDIISNLIRYLFKNFNNKPDYTRVVIDALSNGIDVIPKVLEILHGVQAPTTPIVNIIQDGINSKKFRNVDPKQTLISIAGMTFIYFLSRSIIKIFDVKIDNEEDFIRKRSDSMIDLIMNGILSRKA
jgi:AcrR family transcriptional regulator